MKKKIALLTACLFAVSGMAGCGNKSAASSTVAQSVASTAASSAQSAAQSGGHHKIGFTATTMNNPYFHVIADSVEKVVKQNGDTLVTTDPQNDQSKQNDQVDDMLSQGIDVLLLCPIDSQGCQTALTDCQKKNVKVVVFDTPANDTSLVAATVASDNYNTGVVDAKDMMSKLKKGSKIAIINSPTAKACNERVQGFKDTIKDYFSVVATLNGKGDTGVTLPIAEDLLQSTPDLGAFFAVNDPSAIGCIQAVTAKQKTGKVLVYGVDGNPEAKAQIKAGKMTATGAQSPMNIGTKAVEAAYKLLKGESVEKDITVPTFIITASNVDKYGTTSWQ